MMKKNSTPTLLGTHSGKVRHTWIFSNHTRLIETTDRISAFDAVLPFTVENKGQLLQKISQHFFSLTRPILDNHFIAALSPQLMLTRNALALPIEIIVRGYLCGSLWRAYKKDVQACNEMFGCKLVSGLKEGQEIDPLVTFTTKATAGQHDETISDHQTEAVLHDWLQKNQLGHLHTASQLLKDILSKATELFRFGSHYAKKRDLILVDTKFEMGLDTADPKRSLLLIDECFTPDSSRYWTNLTERTPLSKELLRTRLLERFGEEALQHDPSQAWVAACKADTVFMTQAADDLAQVYQQAADQLVDETPVSNSNPAQQFLATIDSDKPENFLTAIDFENLRNRTLFPENILILGNGGREHAIYKLLTTRHEIKNIYAQPGGRHWGISLQLPLSKNSFLETLSRYNIGCVIVGPEDMLAAGVADWCAAANVSLLGSNKTTNVPVLGPVAVTAKLETSKWFCKQIAIAADVPTPTATLHSLDELKNLKHHPVPTVLKFDGLAAGKGVFVISDHKEWHHALEALKCFCPKPEQKNILMEDLVKGTECSAIALCSGTQFRMLPFARDHKRRFDDDKGPNTGGMGTFAPVPLDEEMNQRIHVTVERILAEMQRRGTPFYGFLFCGFMIDSEKNQLWLLECNTRLGDPEAEVLLPSLDANEFLTECLQVAQQKPFLSQGPFATDGKKRVYVVGTTDEYPASSSCVYRLDATQLALPNLVNHSLTAEGVCRGGRILGCLGTGNSFSEARTTAYDTLATLRFLKDGNPHSIACRQDIAARAQ